MKRKLSFLIFPYWRSTKKYLNVGKADAKGQMSVKIICKIVEADNDSQN